MCFAFLLYTLIIPLFLPILNKQSFPAYAQNDLLFISAKRNILVVGFLEFTICDPLLRREINPKAHGMYPWAFGKEVTMTCIGG